MPESFFDLESAGVEALRSFNPNSFSRRFNALSPALRISFKSGEVSFGVVADCVICSCSFVAKLLGAEILLMGSAVGGMNPAYGVGDVVVICDHINFMGVNPLVGPNDERIGPRWPDMIEPYAADLIHLAHEAALNNNVRLHEAVYAGVLGPCLETRAEYRMLRAMGADVVGMSTVPETIAAVHSGLKVLTFAIVTDRCLPDALEPANIESIIAAANSAEPVIGGLVEGVLGQL